MKPSRIIWNTEVVELIWPRSAVMLPRPLAPAQSTFLQEFLTAAQGESGQAFECLRLARWGKEKGVHVTCPQCGQHAWAHTSRKPKHRWRCVSAEMYRAHQDSKGFKVQSSTRNGCGETFDDTTGTPLEKTSVPLGVVFFALYTSQRVTEQLLRQRGDQPTVAALGTVLRALRAPAQTVLHQRMRCFAKLFCGRILLTQFKHLLTAVGSAQASERLTRYELTLAAVKSMNAMLLADVNVRYQKVQSWLGQLQGLHKAFYLDEPVDFKQVYGLYTAILAELVAIMSRIKIPASKMPEVGA